MPSRSRPSWRAMAAAWSSSGSTASVRSSLAAAAFGRELARLHSAGAEHFGAPWPGSIAGLPLPNEQADSWPEWYAANRLLPYARIARDHGSLTAADTRLVESAMARCADVAGPAEPPSRIHGDCWSGNVLWSHGRGWLIDPAAHGGHRETDLAMLALFGAPHLHHIQSAYQEAAPLADGWREPGATASAASAARARVPVRQLLPGRYSRRRPRGPGRLARLAGGIGPSAVPGRVSADRAVLAA